MMDSSKKMTRQDAIILFLSAHFGSMSIENIIVGAWQMFPMVLGLHGYETQYPDTRRIDDAFYGKCGLVRKHLVKKTEPGRYMLIRPKGMAAAFDARARLGLKTEGAVSE